eukprot:363899-Chlamydomonas_euryale.AAC.2
MVLEWRYGAWLHRPAALSSHAHPRTSWRHFYSTQPPGSLPTRNSVALKPACQHVSAQPCWHCVALQPYLWQLT